jgi:hypothetical protein
MVLCWRCLTACRYESLRPGAVILPFQPVADTGSFAACLPDNKDMIDRNTHTNCKKACNQKSTHTCIFFLSTFRSDILEKIVIARVSMK